MLESLLADKLLQNMHKLQCYCCGFGFNSIIKGSYTQYLIKGMCLPLYENRKRFIFD